MKIYHGGYYTVAYIMRAPAICTQRIRRETFCDFQKEA